MTDRIASGIVSGKIEVAHGSRCVLITVDNFNKQNALALEPAAARTWAAAVIEQADASEQPTDAET